MEPVAAPGGRPDVTDAVYLAGPKRIQSTPYWRASVDALRRRFSRHKVVVAGDGTCPGGVPVHKLRALVLVVPTDRIIGYDSFVEVACALQKRRPTWVSIGGELHDAFALRVNDRESNVRFGRVEPAIDGVVTVEEYPAKSPRRPEPQMTRALAPEVGLLAAWRRPHSRITRSA